MDDKEKDEAAEAAEKTGQGGGGGDAPDDKARIQELEAENKELKQQVLVLKKRVEEMEAEKQAAANKTRAQKLLAKVEKHGVGFTSDEEREEELTRLAALSDDAFTASEAAYDRMIQAADSAKKDETESDEKPANKAKADQTSEEKALRSDAGVRPKDVDDRKTSLEDQLTNGLMAAYRHRVGAAEQPANQT